MKKFTCFVVSPIGDKDSETRRQADDLYELLIEPSLEKFGFAVTRADKISSVSSITSDIVEHLQNADLCIIDITGHNPNVMYECGRRHETGKPYIMVAREGEKLPFDITTIRTFFYNLEKPREILATKNSIQEAVEKMMQEGFRTEASGDSLASVVELLRRIERKIDALPAGQGHAIAGGAPGSATAADLVKKLGLIDAFNYAVSQRDPELIDALLPRLRKNAPRNRKNYVLNGIGTGAMLGSSVAFQELEQALPLDDEYTEDEKNEALGCYVSGATKLGVPDRALQRMEEIYGPLLTNSPSGDLSAEQRAFILNQYQRLLYSVGRFDDAVAVCNRVLELCPTHASYLYNQSLNYEEAGNLTANVEIVDRLMKEVLRMPLDRVDSDHLRQAARTYARAGETAKLLDVYNILQRADPLMAQVVADMNEVSKLLKRT